ncbi:MAG: glycine cleavage T C-terminal barrel domain-containing protein, partial [Pseudomonadota bacterium]
HCKAQPRFNRVVGVVHIDPKVAIGFAVKLDKTGGFIGRDALAAIKARGVPQTRMLQFLLNDPEPLLYGNELIYLGSEQVGYIQVGGYGHTLMGAVGIGFVELDRPVSADLVAKGPWSVEVAGQRIAANASLKPMLDPKLENVRC